MLYEDQVAIFDTYIFKKSNDGLQVKQKHDKFKT